ncbi:NHLP-related RiPP peptide [Xanthomonas vasicola]|uniref:NHLP-related RiPP peptide n=1 Tax=Xanthomonas vasicola TaxID=56459 RepID=UPI00210BB8BE|nr:NHLP-related RiPP peptide [Xanthomonas vasicola]MDO6937831.1 NHLP-related RiPP peptide [Xanthomonas vasicola]
MHTVRSMHPPPTGCWSCCPTTMIFAIASNPTQRTIQPSAQSNPAQALAQIGIAGTSADKSVPSAGEHYYCMTTNQLASKQDIALARAELQSYLTEKTNHTVIFAFDSESIRSTLLRK